MISDIETRHRIISLSRYTDSCSNLNVYHIQYDDIDTLIVNDETGIDPRIMSIEVNERLDKIKPFVINSRCSKDDIVVLPGDIVVQCNTSKDEDILIIFSRSHVFIKKAKDSLFNDLSHSICARLLI